MNQFLKMTVCVSHGQAQSEGLRGALELECSLMEGLENEEGGEERKIQGGTAVGGGGEEMVPLLCQGMPLTEIEGYCFYGRELF